MATHPIRQDAPTAAPHLLVDAAVRRVTMLEDRAQVRREATVKMLAGSQRIKVPGIAPVIADRSLVVRAGEGVRVDEARVTRQWRIGYAERPPDAAELAEETAKLQSELRRKEDLFRLAAVRGQKLDDAADLLIAALNRELPFAKELPSSWAAEFETYVTRAREAEADLRVQALEVRELKSKAQALSLRAAAFGRVDHVLATELEIELTAAAAGERTITIEYLVPCALWRPAHRARLEGSSVRFECEGAVWQRTGEDWKDVDLFFSTARSTQRSEPPVMSDDFIRVQKRQDRTVTVGVREQEIETTGEDGEDGGGSADLPGVDDGGETRLLGAATRATIPSDGRLYRVPIFAFDSAADVDRIARPERSPLVHLRSRQPNASKHPILAGPLELLRDSGYVGRSKVDFVAPGETFAIGWGGEDALRIKRELHVHRETAKLTGRQTITKTVTLYLSNLGDAAAAFRLEERVPVSEIEKVSITVDAKETSPATEPDAQGIAGWNLTLPPRGTQKVKLVHRIVASSDVQGL